MGVICISKGEKVLVIGDIWNGNGWIVKLCYVILDWVNYFSEKIDVVFWIMKDDLFLLIIKINDLVLVVFFGVILVIKWLDVENIIIKR